MYASRVIPVFHGFDRPREEREASSDEEAVKGCDGKDCGLRRFVESPMGAKTVRSKPRKIRKSVEKMEKDGAGKPEHRPRWLIQPFYALNIRINCGRARNLPRVGRSRRWKG